MRTRGKEFVTSGGHHVLETEDGAEAYAAAISFKGPTVVIPVIVWGRAYCFFFLPVHFAPGTKKRCGWAVEFLTVDTEALQRAGKML
jgi:hypothetical protein